MVRINNLENEGKLSKLASNQFYGGKIIKKYADEKAFPRFLIG